MICDTCGGEGFIVTCFDDICVGMGECIHGDGEELCPDCHGEGSISEDEDDLFPDYEEDYYPDESDFPTEEEEALIEQEEYEYNHGICPTCGGEWGEGWSTCTCDEEDQE